MVSWGYPDLDLDLSLLENCFAQSSYQHPFHNSKLSLHTSFFLFYIEKWQEIYLTVLQLFS